MLQAAINSAKSAPNQIVYWSRLFDWKNQTLTPNPDVIYVMPFFNTKDAGPMVLELPAASDDGSITGTIMDCWQAPLEDVGPAGADKGKGGKYLILPPTYEGAAPDGYIALRSLNFQGYALLRSILKGGSEADLARAIGYARRIKFYPLSEAPHPPETKFVDAIDVVFDATIPYDLSFFQSLDRIVQIEPWLPRDKAMIDMLKSIGIVKGKPFSPSQKAQETLSAAAREARAWFDVRYESSFETFYEGTRWVLPFVSELKDTVATLYETPDGYSVDGRGLADTYAFSTIKHLGAGQFYLIAIKDEGGAAFDGSQAYRLTSLPTRRSGNIGPWSPMIARRTPSFGTFPGQAAPRKARAFKRTRTAPSMSILAPSLQRERNRTGSRPRTARNSRSCFELMAQKRRFSIKSGNYPTSGAFNPRLGGGALGTPHEPLTFSFAHRVGRFPIGTPSLVSTPLAAYGCPFEIRQGRRAGLAAPGVGGTPRRRGFDEKARE